MAIPKWTHKTIWCRADAEKALKEAGLEWNIREEGNPGVTSYRQNGFLIAIYDRDASQLTMPKIFIIEKGPREGYEIEYLNRVFDIATAGMIDKKGPITVCTTDENVSAFRAAIRFNTATEAKIEIDSTTGRWMITSEGYSGGHAGDYPNDRNHK